METPEAPAGLDAPGEDLLLAIRPNGTVGSAAKIDYGLMGSELVRLAAAGRVDVAGAPDRGARRRCGGPGGQTGSSRWTRPTWVTRSGVVR